MKAILEQLHRALEAKDINEFRRLYEANRPTPEAPLETEADAKGDYLIHKAISLGLEEAADYLLTSPGNEESKAKFDLPNQAGHCPIHLAALSNNLKLVEMLIRAGSKLSLLDQSRNTALLLAATKGYWLIAQALARAMRATTTEIDDNANHPQYCGFGISLLYAVYANTPDSLETARILITKSASVTYQYAPSNNRALHLAAQNGHRDLVAAMLEASVSPEFQNAAGFKAVELAGRNGHLPVVELFKGDTRDFLVAILKNDVDAVKAMIAAGKTIPKITLHALALKGHWLMIKVLAEAMPATTKEVDASPENSQYRGFGFALLGAVKAATKEALEAAWILAAKSPDFTQHYVACKNTALHFAAKQGHEDLVELMLKNAAPTEAQNTEGYKAVELAALEGHLQVVKLFKGDTRDFLVAILSNDVDAVRAMLAAHKAIPKVKLDILTKKGHWLMVKILAEAMLATTKEIDLSPENPAYRGFGISLLHAVKDGSPEAIEAAQVLVTKSPSFSHQFVASKNTALHLAAQLGHKDLVAAMLAAGAPAEGQNTEGYRAIELAAFHGHLPVVELFKGDERDFLAALLKNVELFSEDTLKLLMAIRKNDVDAVKAMIAAGKAIPKIKLDILAKKGHWLMVKILAEAMPATSRDVDLNVDHSSCGFGLSLLHAIDANTPAALEAARVIITKTPSFLNQFLPSKNTALHLAAQHGHMDLVLRMLVDGALPEYQNSAGFKAVEVAALNGNLPMVELFSGDTRDFLVAILKNDVDAVRAMIAAGKAVPKIKLSILAEKDHWLMIRILAERMPATTKEIDANAKNPQYRGFGLSLLHAVKANSSEAIEAARVLITKSPSFVHCYTASKNTALHHAAQQGYKDLVEKMLKDGAPAEEQNTAGFKAIELAAFNGDLQVVQLFKGDERDFLVAILSNNVEAVRDMIAKSKPIPKLSLHCAVYTDNPFMLKLLLQAGANTKLLDERKRSPFMLAIELNKRAVFEEIPFPEAEEVSTEKLLAKFRNEQQNTHDDHARKSIDESAIRLKRRYETGLDVERNFSEIVDHVKGLPDSNPQKSTILAVLEGILHFVIQEEDREDDIRTGAENMSLKYAVALAWEAIKDERSRLGDRVANDKDRDDFKVSFRTALFRAFARREENGRVKFFCPTARFNNIISSLDPWHPDIKLAYGESTNIDLIRKKGLGLAREFFNKKSSEEKIKILLAMGGAEDNPIEMKFIKECMFEVGRELLSYPEWKAETVERQILAHYQYFPVVELIKPQHLDLLVDQFITPISNVDFKRRMLKSKDQIFEGFKVVDLLKELEEIKSSATSEAKDDRQVEILGILHKVIKKLHVLLKINSLIMQANSTGEHSKYDLTIACYQEIPSADLQSVDYINLAQLLSDAGKSRDLIALVLLAKERKGPVVSILKSLQTLSPATGVSAASAAAVTKVGLVAVGGAAVTNTSSIPAPATSAGAGGAAAAPKGPV